MVSRPHRTLALRRLAGLAVEDTTLPLTAGSHASQKLEGIVVFGLHAQRRLVTNVLDRVWVI